MSSFCMIGHPASGHINPTLPVIAELTRRGHRVVYYATDLFRERIERTGAIFRSLGGQELFERNLARGGMLGGMAGLLQTTEEILPELLHQLRDDPPDCLLSEAHAVWGNLLAQLLPVPAVTLCSMFAIRRQLISAVELMQHLYGHTSSGETMDGLLGLSRYFEIARGLQSRYNTRSPAIIEYLGNPQPLNIVFTSREFQVGGSCFDDSYCFVGPSVDERVDDHDLAGTELDGRPLILISMGTMYNDEAELYHACFDAFGDGPCQVVLAIGHRIDPSRLRPPPSNFVVRSYVPQLTLLRRASLFITHGGINSAHEAMMFGVPMLVLPQRADHHIVARQVSSVGAGVALERSLATAAELRRLASLVLQTESFRQQSARIGATLRAAGGHQRAADLILACCPSARA